MPIYEFYCPSNNKLYTFLARSQAQGQTIPRCPDNADWPMEKRVSAFSITGKISDETADSALNGVAESRMEELFREMETELSELNATNRNPKQLGHLLRKITEAMGGKTPPELHALVRRLEAGEDPEKLESQFSEYQAGENDALFSEMKKILHHCNSPIRDPKLYEMQDYFPVAS